MEDGVKIVKFEEVLDTELDDIWDIFFPKASERSIKKQNHEDKDKTKPRRYLKFLTM